MRVTYDHIVNVSTLKRPITLPHLERANGYAVQLESVWFWFPAIEPAYAFGRAGRMSAQVGSYAVIAAATEVRFDPKLDRDVRTLYLLSDGMVDRGAKNDRELLARFVDGVDSRSSHWTRPVS